MASRLLLLLLAAGRAAGWPAPRFLTTSAPTRADPISGACNNVSAISVGVDTLLAEYAQYAAPAAPVGVRAALDVRHAAVDERAGVVRLLAELRLSWEDPRLSWNASEWDCGSVLVPAERLWRPDVQLLNGAAGADDDSDGSLRVRVTADSQVLWITRINVAVPVAIDLSDWPQDKQSCVFTFGSREHTAEEITLTLDDFKYATVWEAGSWEIESVASDTGTLGAKPVLSWNMTLKRRAAAHALACRAVLAAAVLLLATAAVLPPQQRHSLCASAAFTAALWMVSALLRLPGSSTSPRALAGMAGVCGSAGACCAGAALLARLARARRPPPPLLRALLNAAPAWTIATAPEDAESACASWAAAAQLLDNVLRAALAIVLLTLVCITL